MEEWKVRQEVFHKIQDDHYIDDVGSYSQIIEKKNPSEDELVKDVLYFFDHNPDILTYPAKSYFVGIVYSHLLNKHFDVDFFTALDDEQLLYGNDPHFKKYSDNKAVYDRVLEVIGTDFDISKGQCPDVENYFFDEFMMEA